MKNNSTKNSAAYGLDPASRLYKPVRLGTKTLKNRIALAPLTRYRAVGHVVNDLHVQYYKQRASAGLIVTEATFISLKAGGYPNSPGIYKDEHVAAWRRVCEAVHESGGVIYCQLWALGRANQGQEGNVEVVSSGDLSFPGSATKPRSMTRAEIREYIEDYRFAAKRAVEAGFDGVEIHGAHGYLPDQFLQKSCNNRTDSYGGSLQNRSRFILDILDAVSSVVGDDRMAIRLSPFSEFQGMGNEADPYETWGYLISAILKDHPQLAYISLTDPRLQGQSGSSSFGNKVYSNDYFRALIRGVESPQSNFQIDSTMKFPEPTASHPTVVLSAGGFLPSDAEPQSDRTGDLIGFGRIYIPNPDLVYRLRNGIDLTPYNRKTFYTQDEIGYTDYQFADENTPKFVPTKKSEEQELKEKLETFKQSFEALKRDYRKLKSKL